MGNQLNYSDIQPERTSDKSQMHSVMILENNQELQQLVKVITERGNSASNQFILTIKGYKILNQAYSICNSQKVVDIFYENYDETLQQYLQKHRTFVSEQFVYNFVYCIASGLYQISAAGKAHGDLSLHKICRCGSKWKIVDREFIEGSITAYQKVLTGNRGLISPEQMSKIRQGSVKESPPLRQSDDVFALGMILLEILTGMSSFNCYHQSFLRFDFDQINERLAIVREKYSPSICWLVNGMLELEHTNRLGLYNIQSRKEVAFARKLRIKELLREGNQT